MSTYFIKKNDHFFKKILVRAQGLNNLSVTHNFNYEGGTHGGRRGINTGL
jgi:hypothetical protein